MEAQAMATPVKRKPGAKLGEKQIRWTGAEWEAVLSAAAMIHLDDPSRSMFQAMREAQAVLSEERRKTRSNSFAPSQVSKPMQDRFKWYVQRYEKAKQEDNATKRAHKAEEEAQALRDQVAKLEALLEHSTRPQAAPNAAHPPLPTSPLQLIAQAFSMMLGNAVAEAVRSPQVHQALREALPQLIGTHTPPVAPIAAPPAAELAREQAAARVEAPRHVPFVRPTTASERLKRVLVVGLLGSQAEAIRRDFGDKLDLRFLTQEDSSQRIKENAEGADKVYGMVGYMGHHVEKAIIRGGGRDKYLRINGTTSELKTALNAFVSNHATIHH